MMTRMPLLAAAALGGRRRLVDRWATAPSAFNWQEPLEQEQVTPSSTWSTEATIEFLFVTCLAGFVLACCAMIRLYCCNKKDDDQHDTRRFGLGNNGGVGEGVGSPQPPPQEEQQPLPASGDGLWPRSNSGEEGDRPSRRRRRQRQQPPAVAEMPAGYVETVLGDVPLTQAGVEWVLANLDLLAPVADVDIEPVAEEEIVPAQEPGPTLKCTYRTADGWAEGTCSVCLSELVDGEMVRVLTACMHCFHATCIETWLRGGNANCPLCRAPVMVFPARRRRRRRSQA